MTDKINVSQRRKLERAHEHIGYLQAALRRLIGEKQFENAPEIELDYDFDQDETQLVAQHDEAAKVPEVAIQPEPDDAGCFDDGSVIKMPTRRRK